MGLAERQKHHHLSPRRPYFTIIPPGVPPIPLVVHPPVHRSHRFNIRRSSNIWPHQQPGKVVPAAKCGNCGGDGRDSGGYGVVHRG